ncbi:MAG: serine hydrolase [Bacteroidales bacterium]|nr:serine hydrolase [Bacteroidales bacterium]MDD4420263.1 serine hydrolase [Bacteroidales bacterium]
MKIFKNLISTVLLFALVLTGGSISAKKVTVSSQTKKDINADIAQIMKEFNTVGLGVAVVRNGQIVYANSWGYKNLENKTPLKNDDIFRIASISKSFTSTAIMQLVEQGKISLDEDVSDLIGFKVRNPKYPDVKITVKMLLSHTSSLNDSEGYFTIDVIDPSKSKTYYKAYNDYKPGTGYEYANLGYNTLGTILERVSGERFDRYIVNHILKPLNVYGGYWVASLDKSKFVNLYNWNNDTKKYDVRPEAYDPRTEQIANYQMGRSTAVFSPTGGMKLSPTGLATVMMMHMGLGTYNGKKIISKESAEMMQSAQFGPDDEYDHYGFALRRGYELLDGYEMIGHVGEAYGVHTSMFWNSDRTFGFVVMTNGNQEKWERGFMAIHRRVDKCLYNRLIKNTSADTRKAEIEKMENHDATINRQIDSIMKVNEAVGLGVAVVKDGRIIYRNTWGYKNLENKTPLAEDDLFRIASISKSFTATSIMQLVEQGKLSLDTDVSDLVGFKVRNPKYPDVKITLYMLLSHSSSLNDSQGYFTLDVINPKKSKDYAKAYNDYCPGTKYKYCNLGYNTLGTILERTSGERFDQYVVHHVLNPLFVYGGYWVASLDSSKFVTLYDKNEKTGKYEPQPEAYDPRTEQIANYQMGYSTPVFSPTGGMKLSPTGLATVMMMHMGLGKYMDMRIIKPESALLMQSRLVGPTDEGDDYGFAIRTSKQLLDGKTMIGHTGSAYGVFTSMFWNRERTFGIVVMTNGCNGRMDHHFMSIHRDVDKCLYDNLIKGTEADR